MKGVNKFDLAVIGGFTLASVGVTAFFYYTVFMYKKPLMNEEVLKKEILEAEVKPQLPKGLELDRFVINLPSNRSRLRFLEVKMNILPIKEKDIEIFKNHIPQFRDIVIDTAGGMEPGELNSIAGKVLLEERIKRNFRVKTELNLISKIFYTKFVVQ